MHSLDRNWTLWELTLHSSLIIPYKRHQCSFIPYGTRCYKIKKTYHTTYKMEEILNTCDVFRSISKGRGVFFTIYT